MNFDVSVSRFNEFAHEYANRFVSAESYADSLNRFCSLIETKQPHILELGCGPGNVTKFMAQQFPECRMIALDLAPKMLEIARKEIPEVDFRLMDVRNISSLPHKFDAVLCAFCLPFLSGADARKLISDSANRLHSGGVIYISTMEGGSERAGFETTSFSGNSEIYFNYHLKEDLESSLIENGFDIKILKRQDYTEPDGSTTTDLIFIGVKQ